MLIRSYRYVWLWSAYWRLYPLWAVLRRAVPEVELPLEPAMRRNIRYRLHRRIIEIRDAQLMLRPYSTSQVAGYAAAVVRSSGLAPGRGAAIIEAAVIMESLQRRLRGSPPSTENFPATHTADMPSNDIRAEAARLIMVGRALRRSPLVRRVVRVPPDQILLLGSSDERSGNRAGHISRRSSNTGHRFIT